MTAGLVKDPRFSSSLLAGIAIIEMFPSRDSRVEPTLRVKDVAERLELPMGTAHRYLSTFVRAGWLEQDERRRYRLVTS